MFSASNYIDSVDNAFIFIVVISGLLLLLITFLMVYFVFKYNRKKNVKAENIEGNIPLEITWTVIPVILTMGMFYLGWEGYVQFSNPPADAIPIKVTGQMWKWNFEYANGVKTDTLYVPLNKAVKLELSSIDVNHSFYVPGLRLKQDAMPNRKNTIWFRADKLKWYDIACAEYCGLQHSYMYTKVIVMPEKDFTFWLDTKSKEAAVASGSTLK